VSAFLYVQPLCCLCTQMMHTQPESQARQLAAGLPELATRTWRVCEWGSKRKNYEPASGNTEVAHQDSSQSRSVRMRVLFPTSSVMSCGLCFSTHSWPPDVGGCRLPSAGGARCPAEGLLADGPAAGLPALPHGSHMTLGPLTCAASIAPGGPPLGG
jgi:hypothetical protein